MFVIFLPVFDDPGNLGNHFFFMWEKFHVFLVSALVASFREIKYHKNLFFISIFARRSRRLRVPRLEHISTNKKIYIENQWSELRPRSQRSSASLNCFVYYVYTLNTLKIKCVLRQLLFASMVPGFVCFNIEWLGAEGRHGLQMIRRSSDDPQ